MEPPANFGKAMGQLHVPYASCGAQVLQVRALTVHDAFHGRHGHGLHALPITVLGEHVDLEVGDVGLEVGEHPLGRRPSTFAAHASKIVSEQFQKEQCSNMQFQRPKQRIAGNSTLLNSTLFELPDKVDRSNRLQVILRINAVDSENWPACLPIIALVELTKPSWNVLQQNGRSIK
jgi:hypothetical protein